VKPPACQKRPANVAFPTPSLLGEKQIGRFFSVSIRPSASFTSTSTLTTSASFSIVIFPLASAPIPCNSLVLQGQKGWTNIWFSPIPFPPFPSLSLSGRLLFVFILRLNYSPPFIMPPKLIKAKYPPNSLKARYQNQVEAVWRIGELVTFRDGVPEVVP
jgi:hypothetical protein